MQDIKITVKVEGLEPLISAIMYLGGAIQDQTGAAPKAQKKEKSVTPKDKADYKPEVKEEPKQEDPKDEKLPWDDQDSNEITIEDVRVKLVEISKQGKEQRAAVKQLIQDYGADQLSDLDPKHFAEVLEKAEAI
jgi:hypothetical protein